MSSYKTYENMSYCEFDSTISRYLFPQVQRYIMILNYKTICTKKFVFKDF